MICSTYLVDQADDCKFIWNLFFHDFCDSSRCTDYIPPLASESDSDSLQVQDHHLADCRTQSTACLRTACPLQPEPASQPASQSACLPARPRASTAASESVSQSQDGFGCCCEGDLGHVAADNSAREEGEDRGGRRHRERLAEVPGSRGVDGSGPGCR